MDETRKYAHRAPNFIPDKSLLRPKFSYKDYQIAHAWLDEIFFNGCTTSPSEREHATCICELCGGKCCISEYKEHITELGYSPHPTSAGKPLPTLTWNENIYFRDPEFTDGLNGSLICHRKDPKMCANKMILCKIHPFYPVKIHILPEECNYSIYLASYSSDRRMCTGIEYRPEQLRELSHFFQWLYGEFPENRLTYIAHSFISYDGSPISPEKFHDAFFKGFECTINTIYKI